MKLDTNRAWESGMRFVGNNKGLLAALGGIFIFLPQALSSLIYPQPEVTMEMSDDERGAIMWAWLGEAWWLALIAMLLGMIGSLAIYRLATKRDDATVQEALGDAVKALLPYIGAQILLTVLIAVVAFAVIFAVMLLGMLLGGEMLGVVLALLVMVPILFWFAARGSMIAPVMMAQEERNPIAALKQSFALTKGHALRIAVFILLLVIAAAIVLVVLQGLLGLLFTVVLGADGAAALGTIAFALIAAVVSVVFTTVFAAIYRQLAGTPASGSRHASVPHSAE